MSDTNAPDSPGQPPPQAISSPAVAAPAQAVRPAARRSPVAPVVVVLAAVVLAWFIFHPRENSNEKLATEVTQAIVNNNMAPVAKDFNAIPRAKLENRALVGRLSDDLIALGKLKDIKEDTPSGSAAAYHHFQAHFEKGTWLEDMTLDSDGKIAAFHVHPSNPVQ